MEELGKGKNDQSTLYEKNSIKHNFNKEAYSFSWILHIKTLPGTVTIPPLVLAMHSHFYLLLVSQKDCLMHLLFDCSPIENLYLSAFTIQ